MAFVPIPLERIRGGLGAWGLSDSPVAPLPRGVIAEVFLVRGPAGECLVAKHGLY